MRRAGETFERAGVEVESVDGAGIRGARRVWMDVCTPEFHDAHPLPEERLRLVDPSVLVWWRQGERMSEEERNRAGRRREEIARWFRHRLQGFDALLIPGGFSPDRLYRFAERDARRMRARRPLS